MGGHRPGVYSDARHLEPLVSDHAAPPRTAIGVDDVSTLDVRDEKAKVA